jgi:hypothetical protein
MLLLLTLEQVQEEEEEVVVVVGGHDHLVLVGELQQVSLPSLMPINFQRYAFLLGSNQAPS